MAATEKTNEVTPSSTKKGYDRAMPSNKARIISLVIGDTFCFLLFAAIGRGSHGEATGLAAIPQIIETALPFLTGWFLVAPFVGAFRRDLAANPRKMSLRTLLSWVLAWPVAMAIRGIFVDHGIPPLTFALITLIFNTIFLLLWRWPYALNNSMKGSIK